GLVRPFPRCRQAAPAPDAADEARNLTSSVLDAGPERPDGRARTRVYPRRPMAVQSRDTLSRERASELVRAWARGRPGALGTVLGRVTAVDQVGVEQRVDGLKRRPIKKAPKRWPLDLAIRMMDLTTREG